MKTKASELRIGNIHQTDPISIPREGFQTANWSMITAQGILYVEQGTMEFEPVLLTEEWLVRFGFEQEEYIDPLGTKDKHGDWVKSHKKEGVNGTYTDLRISERTHGGYNWITGGYCRPIYHVHDLQNFYYAMNCEELQVKK